ncbi:hypothetical protein [Streptomyces sp. NPDC008092]|uniref:hypothetical protein n=1 Tax=Streptomyces sp. NPDC008092 TaxID=3364808 RepID=UPI0036E39051
MPESSPPALGEREWLLVCLCARPVTDLLQGQGWDVVTDRQAFGPDTSAQAVAGFLAALIASPTRHCTCV